MRYCHSDRTRVDKAALLRGYNKELQDMTAAGNKKAIWQWRLRSKSLLAQFYDEESSPLLATSKLFGNGGLEVKVYWLNFTMKKVQHNLFSMVQAEESSSQWSIYLSVALKTFVRQVQNFRMLDLAEMHSGCHQKDEQMSWSISILSLNLSSFVIAFLAFKATSWLVEQKPYEPMIWGEDTNNENHCHWTGQGILGEYPYVLEPGQTLCASKPLMVVLLDHSGQKGE